MSVRKILLWEATNLLLPTPAVIGLVMLTRWFQGDHYSPTDKLINLQGKSGWLWPRYVGAMKRSPRLEAQCTHEPI
jgi:hypothetical protein